jgi:hypothetical protein
MGHFTTSLNFAEKPNDFRALYKSLGLVSAQ